MIIFSGDKVRHQLEWQCQHHAQDGTNPFPCGATNFCTRESRVCDGVANCPQGEDEILEECLGRDAFSDLATIECPKKDIYNVTITIRAVPCDGNYECENDEDEQNCSLPDYILIVTLVTIMSILAILGYFLWISTTAAFTKKNPEASWPSDFELIHGTEALRETMFQTQSLENSEKINSEFIDVEMKIHSEELSEVVCCIKVCSNMFLV